jgi:hypothetical protein
LRANSLSTEFWTVVQAAMCCLMAALGPLAVIVANQRQHRCLAALGVMGLS